MTHVRISSETIGDEFYLFMNGMLVYKRWLTPNKGRMFYENETIPSRLVYRQNKEAIEGND